MSENPVHAERSRHIDTRKWFLRDMVRDKLLKLRKCAGTQNVADALTKSLPAPSFTKHREYLFGSRIPCEAFNVSVGASGVTPAGKACKALQCARVASGA
eukprot:1788199-Rhodomonas_salina.1